MRFDAASRRSISLGIEQAAEEFDLRIHACAISRDHVHVVVARDAHRSIEQVVSVLKHRATMRMWHDQTHAMRAFEGAPTAWGKGCWKVFINTQDQLRAAVAYVEHHPIKEGLPPQPWSFLTPIDPA